jgi:hypothetical protein
MMRNDKSEMRSIFNLSRKNPKFQPHLSELKSFDIGNSLPLRYKEGPEVTLGLLVAIFGTTFFALGFISLIPSFLVFMSTEVAAPGDKFKVAENVPMILIGTALLLIGFLMFRVSVSKFGHRIEIIVDRERVLTNIGKNQRAGHWEEPLTAYLGIVCSRNDWNTTHGAPQRIQYRVGLKHKTEAERDIVLFTLTKFPKKFTVNDELMITEVTNAAKRFADLLDLSVIARNRLNSSG